ncbi:hypothetical protein GCM10009590_18930 [Brachybacterium alimentarium]
MGVEAGWSRETRGPGGLAQGNARGRAGWRREVRGRGERVQGNAPGRNEPQLGHCKDVEPCACFAVRSQDDLPVRAALVA